MRTVTIQEAEAQLSALIDAVELGEEVLVTEAGTPVAMLVPARRPRRTPGALQGKIRIADDFNAPLPKDMEAAFDSKLS